MTIPPSLEDLQHYILSRRNGIDPLAFYDFYQSKGWKVGNTKMVDWQAAVRTWERRQPKTVQQDFMSKRTSRDWAN